MILNLNDKWRVRTDKWNYILEFFYVPEKSKSDEPMEVWRVDGGYHPSLESAIQKFHSLDLMMSDAEGVQQVLDKIESSRKEIVEALQVYTESKNKAS